MQCVYPALVPQHLREEAGQGERLVGEGAGQGERLMPPPASRSTCRAASYVPEPSSAAVASSTFSKPSMATSAIAARVVALHGGTISAGNLEPHGLAVSIALPHPPAVT